MKHLKNQRGIAGILEVAIVVLVLGALGFVGYRAYQARQAKPSERVQTEPKKTEEKVAVNEQFFTLKLPAGWKKVTVDQSSYRFYAAGKGYFYQDSAGNFFDVHVDLAGSGFASDLTWETSVSGAGYKIDDEIDDEVACAEGSESSAFCERGDGKMVIGIKAESNGGHDYFFMAGNTAKEAGVDIQAFRDILASFKAKQ